MGTCYKKIKRVDEGAKGQTWTMLQPCSEQCETKEKPLQTGHEKPLQTGHTPERPQPRCSSFRRQMTSKSWIFKHCNRGTRMRGRQSTTPTSAFHTFHMHRDNKSFLSTLKINLPDSLNCMIKKAGTCIHSMIYSLSSWFFYFENRLKLSHLLPIIYCFLALTLNKAAFLLI